MHVNPKLEEETLKRMYSEEMLSVPEISKRLGCSSYGVLNALRRFKIPLRSRREASKLRHSHTWTADWESLAKEYEAGRTIEEIAEKANCSLATVSAHLRRLGVSVRPRGSDTPIHPLSQRNSKRINIDIEKAAAMNRAGSTLTEIGKALGNIAVQVVSKRFREANVPVIVNRASKDEFKNVQFQRRKVARAINATACVICGETRAVDLCHIFPRHRGGELVPDNTIALCQTHHHCFDRGTLKGAEIKKIKPFLQQAAAKGFTHPHYSG
jgi:DNA-binding CsgD family transcriptional regulator/5-methylcytosine-specific restriction endonuclease McrA